MPKNRADDPVMSALLEELRETRFALSQAYARFNGTADAALIDSCVYEISAAEARYNYLLRSIKRHSADAAGRERAQ